MPSTSNRCSRRGASEYAARRARRADSDGPGHCALTPRASSPRLRERADVWSATDGRWGPEKTRVCRAPGLSQRVMPSVSREAASTVPGVCARAPRGRSRTPTWSFALSRSPRQEMASCSSRMCLSGLALQTPSHLDLSGDKCAHTHLLRACTASTRRTASGCLTRRNTWTVSSLAT